jgi:hypothetical protein
MVITYILRENKLSLEDLQFQKNLIIKSIK